MAEKERARSILRASRWLLPAAILLLVFLTLLSFRLGHEVSRRLEGLSTAATDNVQWVLSQAEVEHLKLDYAAQRVDSADDLRQMRRRFDIYYSRISTLLEGGHFQELRVSEAGSKLLHSMTDRMKRLANLIDQVDEDVLRDLPTIHAELEANASDVRELALLGVVMQVEASEEKRLELYSLLARLAIVVVALFVAFTSTALMLARMYRRGQKLNIEKGQVAARMEAMVSSSLDAILVTDTFGIIQSFNGAAEAIFGYKTEEVTGERLSDLLVPPHLRDAHERGLAKFRETGDPTFAGTGRVRLEGMRKTGEVFPVEVSLSISKSQGDTVFVGYIRDISDRIAAEEALRTARDDALAGERAKANLLTVMSHEMRTPLTGILGAIDLLEGLNPGAEQAKYLSAMRISGELLLHHVNDVLQLSKLESGANSDKLTVFDLEDLMEGLVESQQAAAQSSGNVLSLSCDLGVSDYVAGRPRALQQVLLNLIGNALKFTQDGAVNVDVNRLPGLDSVEFHVADTGLGIGDQDRHRIFDDFVTLDSSYGRGREGTGLGLAITRRIVQSLGGTITCESELGEGSLFTVTLPLPPAARPSSERLSRPVVAAEPANILVAEDNDINRALIERMLEAIGHDVTVVPGGEEAIEAVGCAEFDLVFMDISMPKVDGIQALQRIREQKLAEGVDIVALTAHAAPEDHARILKAGFAEVATKPISKQQLEEVISRRLNKSSRPSEQSKDSDIDQFFNALGQERAVGFLKTYCQDVGTFLQECHSADMLSEEHRKEAHRLAGSAAVLGLKELRHGLLAVETAKDLAGLDLAGLSDIWQAAQTELSAHIEPVLDQSSSARWVG